MNIFDFDNSTNESFDVEILLKVATISAILVLSIIVCIVGVRLKLKKRFKKKANDLERLNSHLFMQQSVSSLTLRTTPSSNSLFTITPWQPTATQNATTSLAESKSLPVVVDNKETMLRNANRKKDTILMVRAAYRKKLLRRKSKLKKATTIPTSCSKSTIVTTQTETTKFKLLKVKVRSFFRRRQLNVPAKSDIRVPKINIHFERDSVVVSPTSFSSPQTILDANKLSVLGVNK